MVIITERQLGQQWRSSPEHGDKCQAPERPQCGGGARSAAGSRIILLRGVSGSMKVRAGVEVSSLTDVGCLRENNEDSLGYWEALDDDTFSRLGRLAVVADGMGGCEGGQFASRIAVETVEEIYSKSAEPDPQQRLLHGFREAHARIQQQA